MCRYENTLRQETIRNCFIDGEYWETDYRMEKCRTVTIARISTGKAHRERARLSLKAVKGLF